MPAEQCYNPSTVIATFKLLCSPVAVKQAHVLRVWPGAGKTAAAAPTSITAYVRKNHSIRVETVPRVVGRSVCIVSCRCHRQQTETRLQPANSS